MKWWVIAAGVVALWLLIRRKKMATASRAGQAVLPQLPSEVEARAVFDDATSVFRSPAPVASQVAVDASVIVGPVTPSGGGGFYPSLTDGPPPDPAVTTLPIEPPAWPWIDVSPDTPFIAPIENVPQADAPIPIHLEGGNTNPGNDPAINSTFGPATTDRTWL